jgi:hypothetical protein
MCPPRFSIGRLLKLIAVFAVGLAALSNPSRLWASTTYTVAAVAIVAGVSNAILGRGARRAYWIGFALFGGAYFCLTHGSNRLVTETMLDLLYPHVTRQLPQATLFTLSAQPAFAPTPVPPAQLLAPPPAAVGTPFQVGAYAPPQLSIAPVSISPAVSAWDYWTKPDRDVGEYATPTDFSARFSSVSFRQIGHSLAALLAATLGGIFVRWRYEENSNEIGPAEATPEPGQPETAPTLSA